MRSDGEIAVQHIEGTNIIYQKMTGIITAERAEELYEKTDNIAKNMANPNDIKLLVDAQKGWRPDSKARKKLDAFLKEGKVKKIAIMANRPFERAMLTFLRISSGFDKMRLFKRKDYAVRWLSE